MIVLYAGDIMFNVNKEKYDKKKSYILKVIVHSAGTS